MPANNQYPFGLQACDIAKALGGGRMQRRAGGGDLVACPVPGHGQGHGALDRSVIDLMRRVLRANWRIVLALADKLERDSVAFDTRWRRELLSSVRRIDGGAN
jgi:hypothetical protein